MMGDVVHLAGGALQVLGRQDCAPYRVPGPSFGKGTNVQENEIGVLCRCSADRPVPRNRVPGPSFGKGTKGRKDAKRTCGEFLPAGKQKKIPVHLSTCFWQVERVKR